jgi:hypothetical protein
VLTADEVSGAVSDYGRTLVPLPDAATALIRLYPSEKDPSRTAVDVALWTSEEGRSDLTLCLLATKSDGVYRLEVLGLRVL